MTTTQTDISFAVVQQMQVIAHTKQKNEQLTHVRSLFPKVNACWNVRSQVFVVYQGGFLQNEVCCEVQTVEELLNFLSVYHVDTIYGLVPSTSFILSDADFDLEYYVEAGIGSLAPITK